MDCVFVKARKISKSLKGNRGSVVSYDKYLTRTLPDVDYSDKGEILAKGICGTDERINSFWQKAEERENQTKRNKNNWEDPNARIKRIDENIKSHKEWLKKNK